MEAAFESLAENGKTANFVLSNGNKLVDAATYTLSSDTLAFRNAGFMPKIATAYAKTFEAVTTEVIAGESAKVYFAAKNQYGEAFDLTGNAEVAVSAKLNGMPLNATELPTYQSGDKYVQVNHSLKENDELTITFTNKNKETSVINYTVIKGEDSRLEALDLTASEANIAFGENTTLTLAAKDQYNNPFSVTGAVRWFVDGVETDASTNGTLTLTSELYAKQGTHTVKAFYANNTKKSAEIIINVGASKLTSLTLTDEEPATTYNLDEIVAQKITQTEGAILTPDMLKFNIVAEDTTVEEVTAEDVTVAAKLRGGDNDETKNDIIITVKSAKPGKYTITPYVGESFNDAKAIKASDFVVTTTVDQTIKSIDNIEFDAAELKTGKDIKKVVTFRNKHGEVVVPAASAVDVSVVPGTGLEADDIVNSDGKYEITFNATEAKSYQVVVSTGDLFRAYTLNFAAPKFTSIELGKDVTGVVAGDLDNKAKYQEVKFADQDGQAMSIAKSDLTVSVTKPDGTELEDVSKLVTLGKTYSVDEEGVVTFEAATLDTDTIAAVKVLPTEDLAQGRYTVKVASTADAKVVDTFAITVGEARKVTTLTSTPANTTLAVGATQEITLAPKDQYGDFIAETITATSNDTNKVSVEAVEEVKKDEQVIGYKVRLTAKAKGTTNISFKIGETVLATTNVTVDSVGQLIDHVEFDTKDIKNLYSTESATAEVDLLDKVVAYNGANTVIPVQSSDIGLSVTSVNTTSGTANAAISEGALTVDKDFVGSVTVSAQIGTKSTTITLNFDKAPVKAVKGTTVIKDAATVDADSKTEGVQIALDGVTEDGEENGSIVLKLAATDQYGTSMDTVNFAASGVSIVTDDSSVVSVAKDADADTLTLTSVGAGTANVIVNYNGDTIILTVNVTANGVAALPQANTETETENTPETENGDESQEPIA